MANGAEDGLNLFDFIQSPSVNLQSESLVRLSLSSNQDYNPHMYLFFYYDSSGVFTEKSDMILKYSKDYAVAYAKVHPGWYEFDDTNGSRKLGFFDKSGSLINQIDMDGKRSGLRRDTFYNYFSRNSFRMHIICTKINI